MKSKLFTRLLICFSLFIINDSFAQYQSESKLFANDSIQYKIVCVSPSVNTLKKGAVTRFYVELSLPKKFRAYLASKDTLFWLKHLTDTSSDWATNLVLYYLFDRDAQLIGYVFDNRQKWLKIKSDEILYWKKYFRKLPE